MRFRELTNEQRRQLIDAQQTFRAWREAEKDFRHGYPPLYNGYRAEMRWKAVRGKEYLYRGAKSLGPRSAETERIKADYTEQRTKLRARLSRLEKRLEEMRPVNRALGLGRVPDIAAKVMRKLDREGLLGHHLFVAGTHALYGYEARSGVLFDSDLTATTDIDFLWDVRKRFTFLTHGINERGVIGLLKQVDASFKKTRTYRAENDDPYLVEIIRPERKDEAFKPNPKLTAAKDDFEPAAIEGLNWLLNAPKFEEIVVGEDGAPLFMSCIDPRAFALHKLWLSRRDTREGVKRRRDAAQAAAVAAVATQFMGLKFDKRVLAGLPRQLTDGVEQLAKTKIET